MTKVRDTTQDADVTGALGLLYGFEGKNPSQAIYDQEKRGQHSLVNSAQLPVEGTKGREETFAAMGIKLGPIPTEGDTLFRDAELPEGWTKKGTDHDMHSELLDEKGRKRAGIFYKAAFYDRRAGITLNTRFTHGSDYTDEWNDKVDTATRFMVLRDGTEVLWEIVVDWPSRKTEQDLHYKAKDDHRKLFGFNGGAERWLAEHYPNWQDPSAYWDDE
jgi:hypothetical protein